MKDAFFADPVGIVSCPKSTQAQLIGLAKLFRVEKANILKFHLLVSPPYPKVLS
ncbi:hypothetical protein P692DRAFT_20825746 [Suillus brevipes Sb2]|nr:hypothetical protein P692DRAFT_20825746 [Suillus brevipes Sb2]